VEAVVVEAVAVVVSEAVEVEEIAVDGEEVAADLVVSLIYLQSILNSSRFHSLRWF